MSNVAFTPLANKAAIDYLKKKVPAATAHWDDWIAPVHAKSFTVAGSPSVEFATDMHEALIKAISNGTTITDFRKDFDAIVKKYGWSYKGKRGWRTKVIFNTNMRTARMAAKWQTIQANKDIAPYLEYDAVNDNKTRPLHRSWDGIVLPVDADFWSVYYPPNGWGCRCTVRQLSLAALKREGKSISDVSTIKRRDIVGRDGVVRPNVPEGIDAGWDHNVGQSWLEPDLALGNKLASLPSTMAGYAYQKQVTQPFMDAVSNAWQAFRKNVQATHPKNATQFVGFTSHKIQSALIDKAEAIIAKTDEINAARAANAKNNLPMLAKPDLNQSNLAIIAPDFKVAHLEGAHKAGTLAQWEDDWVANLPSLLHDYQAVLYDVDAQALVYVTKIQKNDRLASAYVNINQSKKKMATSNWVKSLNMKPLHVLNESRFIILDGSLPAK